MFTLFSILGLLGLLALLIEELTGEWLWIIKLI